MVAGVGGAHLIDMVIVYKYSPQQAILLDPKGTSLEVYIKKKEGQGGETQEKKGVTTPTKESNESKDANL